MKLLFTTLLLLATAFYGSSQEGDYIINSDGEKISCEVYSNTYKMVKAVVDKKEIKYKPDEIQGFMNDGVMYESGKVAYGSYGAKTWCFLSIVEEGDMLLCKIEATYYAKDAMRSTATTTVKTPLGVVVHYARLKSSSNDGYIKIGIKWKKDLSTLGSSCSNFVGKVKKEKYASWSDEGKLKALVAYYNSDC